MTGFLLEAGQGVNITRVENEVFGHLSRVVRYQGWGMRNLFRY